MSVKMFTFFLVCLSILGKISSQCITKNDNAVPCKKTHIDLYSGEQDMALRMLKAVNGMNPKENAFFSPYSTYHVLLMAYFISGSNTSASLKKSLNLEAHSKIDIYSAYKMDKYLTNNLLNDSLFEFSSMNKLYLSKDLSVTKCLRDLFHHEFECIDFQSKPEQARSLINNWIKNTTNGMIQELISPGQITNNTNVVLVNAAYFKGVWAKKFVASMTKPEPFYHNPKNFSNINMMHVKSVFRVDLTSKSGFQAIDLPFKDNIFTMIILLPSKGKYSTTEMLKNVTSKHFTNIINGLGMKYRTVRVSLPKISIETKLELVPILRKMGIPNIFQKNADFSILTPQNVTFSDAVHKAKIEIGEDGSRAAAATALFSSRMADVDHPSFICNKPFVYFIYNKKSHTILFSGIFNKV